jgi:uridine kinase
MFNDLFLEANLILNTDDIYYKFGEWQPKKHHNILLVTGLSGSGKSTLSVELHHKYNAKVLHLDVFDQLDFPYDYTGLVTKYFAKRKIDTTNIKRAWEIPDIDYDELMIDFIEFALEEMYKDPSTLYVIEGLQIYVYMENHVIMEFPIIVKGTSYVVAQFRRLQRDGNSKNLLTAIINELKDTGLATFKVNLKDQKVVKSLTRDIKNAQKGHDGMFGDLLKEASMPEEYYLPNGDGKIKAFEDAFGDDEIKKSIAYGFSSSHEYDAPEKKKAAVKSCIKFVNNYDWKKKDHKVDDIEAFNKPLNMKKVFNIAKTIEEKGNTEPLITVDKIHGFNWQSKGKVILTDGNHRLGAIKVLELKTCPIYHGTYTGNAEKDHEEFLPTPDDDNDDTLGDDNFITEAVFEAVPSMKNFIIESTKEYKILTEASRKRKKNKIQRVELTEEEHEAVKAKYGSSSLFGKDANTGKYFCAARATSKLYDSPTDIPLDVYRAVSRTA